jgi:hypothetical protein
MSQLRSGVHEESPIIRPEEDGRAALRMIREAIETHGPPGILPPESLTPGPRMVDEAEVLCAGILVLSKLEKISG